jgi:5'-3' exonuclease
LNYLEIFHNELEGVEADDYIASLTERFKKKFKVFIASSDSDFYQLLGDQVNQIILKRKDNYEVLNHLSVQDKLGIPPSEYVFWKSLVGDRADNIQGIKGIGSKRATKIVNGLIDFDDGSYQEVIDKNEKLISLDRSTIQEVNMVDLNYSRKRTFTSNSLIFEAAGLG